MNPFLSTNEPAVWGPGSLEMALPLVESLRIQPDMRILEVGGGSGQITTILAREWNVTVFTLEPWFGGEEIQARAAREGVWDRVIALKLKVQDLPFADDTFDAVMSIGSFEMIGDERPQALAQMVRVARPGARIGIAEPMCHPIPIPPEVAELDRGEPSFRHCFRTVDWNRDLVARAGLAVTESYYFPDAYRWWVEYAAQRKVPEMEQELIDRDQGRSLSLGLVVGENSGGMPGF